MRLLWFNEYWLERHETRRNLKLLASLRLRFILKRHQTKSIPKPLRIVSHRNMIFPACLTSMAMMATTATVVTTKRLNWRLLWMMAIMTETIWCTSKAVGSISHPKLMTFDSLIVQSITVSCLSSHPHAYCHESWDFPHTKKEKQNAIYYVRRAFGWHIIPIEIGRWYVISTKCSKAICQPTSITHTRHVIRCLLCIVTVAAAAAAHTWINV